MKSLRKKKQCRVEETQDRNFSLERIKLGRKEQSISVALNGDFELK